MASIHKWRPDGGSMEFKRPLKRSSQLVKPTKCRPYRPISLSSTGLWIQAAILERCVNKITADVVQPSLTGFTKKLHQKVVVSNAQMSEKRYDRTLLSSDGWIGWSTLANPSPNPDPISLVQTSSNGHKPSIQVREAPLR